MPRRREAGKGELNFFCRPTAAMPELQ